EQVQAFFDAGYDRRAVLDVVLATAQKVMSNYMNHIAQTPIDEVVKPFAWERAGKPQAA
ncbi:MAG: carboxymuconolactone decarboxylase family protein, partial [Pseudomonadota bacterium]